VRNPGLQELPSPLAEAEAPVEPCRLGLGVKHRTRHAAASRTLQQGNEQRPTHAFASPLLQHRHAPDAPVWKQPRRADWIAARVTGKGVIAALVPFVPFELAGNFLLLDEHFFAHRARERQRVAPSHDANGELCGHERLIIRVDQ